MASSHSGPGWSRCAGSRLGGRARRGRLLGRWGHCRGWAGCVCPCCGVSWVSGPLGRHGRRRSCKARHCSAFGSDTPKGMCSPQGFSGNKAACARAAGYSLQRQCPVIRQACKQDSRACARQPASRAASRWRLAMAGPGAPAPVFMAAASELGICASGSGTARWGGLLGSMLAGAAAETTTASPMHLISKVAEQSTVLPEPNWLCRCRRSSRNDRKLAFVVYEPGCLTIQAMMIVWHGAGTDSRRPGSCALTQSHSCHCISKLQTLLPAPSCHTAAATRLGTARSSKHQQVRIGLGMRLQV